MRTLLGETEPHPVDVRLPHQPLALVDFPSEHGIGVEWAADLALRARVESAMGSAVLFLVGDSFRREREESR